MRTPAVLQRIRDLAIPPAWSEVWICPSEDGHLQAIGYDARGRRQYRYHPLFRELRDQAKFHHLLDFAAALPRLRARVDQDLTLRGAPRDKVLAAVIRLLDGTLIRVGNRAYMKQNGSFGLTTLRARHLTLDGAELRFRFKGKGGKTIEASLVDRRLARVVRQIQDLPGQGIFQYRDEAGETHGVTSTDVNTYLKAATGADITAKDFRTWGGTVAAAEVLAGMLDEGRAPAKAHIDLAIRGAANQLGNTPAICRKCYVHPQIIRAYMAGTFALSHHARDGLKPMEAAVLNFLKAQHDGTASAA